MCCYLQTYASVARRKACFNVKWKLDYPNCKKMGVTWQISVEIPNNFKKICFRVVCYVQTEGQETERVARNFYVFEK